MGEDQPTTKAERLTELQAAFVREFVVDFVAGRAWQRAQIACGRKPSEPNVADAQGCTALRIPKVREACNKLRDATAPEPDDMRRRIINELVAIAYSDASGLARWIIESCGSCWDKDPGVLAAIEAGGVYPQKINPKCQYCRGRGVGHVSITPTDKLQPNELRLYDGMEVTSAGVKVRLRDRTKALEMLARHFGIAAVDRLEVTGKDGGPIEITGARERLLANINRRAPR